MTILANRIQIITALSRCPVCGAKALIRSAGDSSPVSVFECAAAFVISNDEIIVSRACPTASYIAVGHLNQEAALALAVMEAASDGN